MLRGFIKTCVVHCKLRRRSVIIISCATRPPCCIFVGVMDIWHVFAPPTDENLEGRRYDGRVVSAVCVFFVVVEVTEHPPFFCAKMNLH